jgi:tetratricopeptide (TPR) repeat protein
VATPAKNPSAGIPRPALTALLVVGTIAAYCRTFSVPLVFDDLPAIVNNPSIRHWSTALSPGDNSTAAGRPILNLSLAINYAIGGLAVGSYHAANLAIHLLAGLTLFGILRRTLAPRSGPTALLVAFCAALLWTLHPLQTESVTYVVQRAESLMGLFYLLTLYGFIRAVEAEHAQLRRSATSGHALHSPRDPTGTGSGPPRPEIARQPWLWWGLSWLACLLGMGTKEVMVSAPVMVLFYDRTFLAGTFAAAWRLRWKRYVGLGATWLVLPLLVFSTHGRAGTSGFGIEISWWRYAQTQFPAILRYLKLSVWPHPLVFDYGTQWTTSIWTVWPCAIVVLGLAAASAWAFFRPTRGAQAIGFAGLWFFAILAPTSLIPGNRQTAAEHRMYLALIPLVVLIVLGIHRRLGRAALPLCLALAAGCFGITWLRNETYHSALSLWADTVAHCPDNAFAHHNLGYQLDAWPSGRTEAMAQYRIALRLSPEFPEAHNNLGYALNAEGHRPEAMAEFNEALRLRPNYAEAHNNLGIAIEQDPDRLNDAITQFREAIRLQPENSEAHNNLGNALAVQPGKSTEAIAEYEQALRLNPNSALAHNNLGNALSKLPGRLNEAIAQLQIALRLKPDYPEADYDLGNALNAAGRPAEAIASYQAAVRLAPDYAEAHNNLANTLNGQGRTQEAVAEYREALLLRPDAAAIHFNFAGALLKLSGRTDEAAAQLETVLRLQPDNRAARQILAQLR